MVQADFLALGIEIQDRRLQPKEELPLQILLQMQRRSKLVTICDCCYRHIAGLVRAPVDRPREIAAPLFTKNRERLITGDIASECMTAVLNQAPVKPLLSDDHFSVDGTLL